MPRSAWNGTSHTVLYVPAGSATVHVSDWPGPMSAPDREPAIAKLCTSWPLGLTNPARLRGDEVVTYALP